MTKPAYDIQDGGPKEHPDLAVDPAVIDTEMSILTDIISALQGCDETWRCRILRAAAAFYELEWSESK